MDRRRSETADDHATGGGRRIVGAHDQQVGFGIGSPAAKRRSTQSTARPAASPDGPPQRLRGSRRQRTRCCETGACRSCRRRERGAGEQALEEVHVLREVPRTQEELTYLRLRRGAQTGRLIRLLEQTHHDLRESVEIAGIDQRPVSPSRIWSWMPPTRLATTGRALPHRLGDRQPEPLGEALLHDDRARRWSALTIAAFSSAIVHRQRHQMHAARASAAGSAAPARDAPPRAPRAPPGRRRRPSRPGRRAGGGRACAARCRATKAVEHADRVLEPVPARDLRRRAAHPSRRGAALDIGARSTRPGVPSWRRNTAPDGHSSASIAAQREDRRARSRRREPGSWPRTGRSTAGSPIMAAVEVVPGERPRARTRTRRACRR